MLIIQQRLCLGWHKVRRHKPLATSIIGGRIVGGGFGNGYGVNFAKPGGGSSMFESTHAR